MKSIFTTKNCVDRRQGKDKFNICWESTKYQLLFHIVSLNPHNDSLRLHFVYEETEIQGEWFIQGHMVTTQQSKNSVCGLSRAPSPYWKSRIGYGWRNYGSKQGRSAGPISQAGLGSSSSREHLSLCILWNCDPGKPSATIHVKEIKRGEDFPGDLVIQSLSHIFVTP